MVDHLPLLKVRKRGLPNRISGKEGPYLGKFKGQMALADKIIFVMGVSGSGKTVIGQQLARVLKVPFVDADDYHPRANTDKMSKGIPLTDEDRTPWLQSLNVLAREQYPHGCVIACSALKEDYRLQLMQSIESRVVWVYLKGSYDLIYQRMIKRAGHFMGAEMLQSQFDTLEEPENALVVDIGDTPAKIVQRIISQ